MKRTPDDIARALIDTCSQVPKEDIANVVDAAIQLLTQQGMAKAIRTFPRTVHRMLQKKYGVLYIELTTPKDAGDTERDILFALSEVLGKSIELSVSSDARLIGGARLRVGDERIDASVRAALESFRSHLVAGNAA